MGGGVGGFREAPKFLRDWCRRILGQIDFSKHQKGYNCLLIFNNFLKDFISYLLSWPASFASIATGINPHCVNNSFVMGLLSSPFHWWAFGWWVIVFIKMETESQKIVKSENGTITELAVIRSDIDIANDNTESNKININFSISILFKNIRTYVNNLNGSPFFPSHFMISCKYHKDIQSGCVVTNPYAWLRICLFFRRTDTREVAKRYQPQQPPSTKLSIRQCHVLLLD